MGNVIFCNKCPDITSQNVITFSELLVQKVSDGIPIDPKLTAVEDEDGGVSTILTEDAYIFKKLQCIDKKHSVENGIRKSDFFRLVAKIEELSQMENTLVGVKMDSIIECYEQNPNCPLNCRDAIYDFMDYIDEQQLIKLKKQVDEDKKKQLDEIDQLQRDRKK